MPVSYRGKDLVYVSGRLEDGGGLEKNSVQWESRPQDLLPEVIKKHGLKKGRPEVRIPEDLLGTRTASAVP